MSVSGHLKIHVLLKQIYMYITVFNAFTCKILSLMHPSKLIKDKKIIKSQIMKNKENTKNKI